MAEPGPRIFLIAGEPSGDRLGAALMSGLVQLEPLVRMTGVGGPLMEGQGLHSLFPMEELSVMGLAEVLPRLPRLLRRARETAEAVVRQQPDILVTIDSPDFCLRVARRARAALPGLVTVHYVAPSVWAWRPERAARMAEVIDHVLAILPFEPPFMERAGMSCDFVGHPAVTDPVPDAATLARFRAEHGLDEGGTIVTMLPGSRRGEVERLFPIFRAALDRLAAERPGLRVVIPAAPPVATLLRQMAAGWRARPIILDPRDVHAVTAEARKRAGLAVGDVALAASGTVSLELARMGTPMVIAYDMNWLSRRIIASKLLVDTVTLVNLVSETRAVPEFIGRDCRPAPIADALQAVLADRNARQAQLDAARLTMERLGAGDEAPGLRAARSVLSRLGADDTGTGRAEADRSRGGA